MLTVKKHSHSTFILKRYVQHFISGQKHQVKCLPFPLKKILWKSHIQLKSWLFPALFNNILHVFNFTILPTYSHWSKSVLLNYHLNYFQLWYLHLHILTPISWTVSASPIGGQGSGKIKEMNKLSGEMRQTLSHATSLLVNPFPLFKSSYHK